MNKKILLAVLLAACLTLTLCACGGETTGPSEEPAVSTTTTTTTAATTTTTAAPSIPTPGEGQVLYSVKVVDAAGAPVVGTYVQLCLEQCVFAGTDAEGVAYFCLAEEDYKVTIIGDPSATEYHFEAGSHELTLTYDAATPTTAATEEPMTNDVVLDW